MNEIKEFIHVEQLPIFRSESHVTYQIERKGETFNFTINLESKKTKLERLIWLGEQDGWSSERVRGEAKKSVLQTFPDLFG